MYKRQVFVQSKVGEGSTFGFRIPFTQVEEEEYIPKNITESQNTDEMPDKNNNDGWEITLEKH